MLCLLISRVFDDDKNTENTKSLQGLFCNNCGIVSFNGMITARKVSVFLTGSKQKVAFGFPALSQQPVIESFS